MIDTRRATEILQEIREGTQWAFDRGPMPRWVPAFVVIAASEPLYRLASTYLWIAKRRRPDAVKFARKALRRVRAYEKAGYTDEALRSASAALQEAEEALRVGL